MLSYLTEPLLASIFLIAIVHWHWHTLLQSSLVRQVADAPPEGSVRVAVIPIPELLVGS
jgi:hypothetical protein